MMKMRMVFSGKPRSMPTAARDAFRAANRRRGRSGPRRGRPSRRRQRLEAYAKRFMAAAARWNAKKTPPGRPRGRGRNVGAMTRRMRAAVKRNPEDRFLRQTGSVPVPDFLVAPWKIEAAEKHAARAAERLGVDTPEIRWFRTIRGGREARGWYDEGVPAAIWLRADLGLNEIPELVAHESKHRADHLQGRPVSEEAAEEFANSFTSPPPRGATRTYSRGRWLAPTTN